MCKTEKTHRPQKDLYKELLNVSKCHEKEWGRVDEDFCMKFSLSQTEGRNFYKSLSNELLLNIIKELASELGHPPSQKEVFWVWREYIKLRFKKWPYALTAAELPKSAGCGGMSLERAEEIKKRKDQLIAIVRQKAVELGRLPHPKDFSDEFLAENDGLYQWNDIIRLAKLDQAFFVKNSLKKIPLVAEDKLLFDDLYALAIKLGRAPLRSEVELSVKETLINRCGTWRNVLFQIGLEPVIKINPFSAVKGQKETCEKSRIHKYSLYDSHYRILNLDQSAIKDLLYIKRIIAASGKIPAKTEVPKDIRARLQKKCGSWTNILYQIQFLKEQ